MQAMLLHDTPTLRFSTSFWYTNRSTSFQMAPFSVSPLLSSPLNSTPFPLAPFPVTPLFNAPLHGTPFLVAPFQVPPFLMPSFLLPPHLQASVRGGAAGQVFLVCALQVATDRRGLNDQCGSPNAMACSFLFCSSS